MRLRVSSIDPSLTKDQLQEIFEEYGGVASVKLFRSLDGSTPALGYVEMKRESVAEIAMKKLNGKVFGDTPLKVEPANEVLHHHGTGIPAVPNPQDDDDDLDVLGLDEEEDDEPREVSLDELPEDY